MKAIRFAIVIIVAATFQSGCAFKDIDKRLFITGVGIDPAEQGKGYKVTLKIALPVASVKDASGGKYAYLTTEGESIGESLRMLETHTDKVLEFGHAKAIVINEKLLKDGVSEFMDYFVRRGDIQLIAYAIAARPSAEEILRVEPDTEAPSSVSINNYFDDTGTESPFITTCFLVEFRRDYLNKGIDAFLPLMETNEDKTELIVNQAVGVGKKDKFVELTTIETKYYNSLFKGKSGFDYKVEHDDLTLMLNIDKVKLNYKIITEKDKPVSIKIDVKLTGIIGQSNKDLSIKKLGHYNKISEKEIKNKLTKFLTKLQEASIDPGFGLRYRATRLNKSGLMEKWDEAYKDIPFDITVDVELKSTGAID